MILSCNRFVAGLTLLIRFLTEVVRETMQRRSHFLGERVPENEKAACPKNKARDDRAAYI